MPPKINIDEGLLDLWISELENMKKSINGPETQEASSKYEKWLSKQQLKVAPGFNYDVMQPVQRKGLYK